MASVLIGHKLQGRIVQSGDKWMIVFPDASELKQLFLDVAKESVSTDTKAKGLKVVSPLSWSAFPNLKKNGGMHITLASEPVAIVPLAPGVGKAKPENVKDKPINVTITGSTIWLEQPYRSSLSTKADQVSYGFFVLLVSIDGNDKLKIKCDNPCHISVGQLVNK